MCQVSTYYAFFNEKKMYRKLLIDIFKTDITITKKKPIKINILELYILIYLLCIDIHRYKQ